MKRRDYIKAMRIDESLITPIYRQIISSIIDGIDEGNIKKNDILPSLHEMCVELNVSKNTVEKAYNILKKQGIVGSYHGKGYFITRDSSILESSFPESFNGLAV